MRLHRTACAAVLASIMAFPASAGGALETASGSPPARIVFPIVGGATFRDDFGEARGQGAHEANDILAARHAPVVAVEDGRVRFWTTSARAGCMLYLEGVSGTQYIYIHLDNDVTDRNDNRGKCVAGTAYAPGLKDGDAVVAGQLIAYVGDSGDADGLHPHLHFELHPRGGAAVSPYRLLRRAHRLLYAADPTVPKVVSLSVTGLLKDVSPDGPDASITVAASKSVLSTGGTYELSRDVVFSLPRTALLGGRAGKGGALAALDRAGIGDRITVTALLRGPMLGTQIAAPRGLAAARILLDAPR